MAEESQLVSGLNAIEAIVDKGGFFDSDVLHVARQNDPRVRKLLSKAKRTEAVITKASYKQLSQLTKVKNHQGIVLERGQGQLYVTYSSSELLQEKENQLFVALDRITDPHNAGAIIRSMLAFETGAIILSKKKSAPLGQAAMRSSAGALANTKVCFVSGLANFLIKADQANFQIIGFERSGIPLKQFVAEQKNDNRSIILIFGSEGEGLSRLVRERCHSFVSIEQNDKIDSLNVASAASIVLYALNG